MRYRILIFLSILITMGVSFEVKVLSVSKIPDYYHVQMKSILVFLHPEFLKLLTIFCKNDKVLIMISATLLILLLSSNVHPVALKNVKFL